MARGVLIVGFTFLPLLLGACLVPGSLDGPIVTPREMWTNLRAAHSGLPFCQDKFIYSPRWEGDIAGMVVPEYVPQNLVECFRVYDLERALAERMPRAEVPR